MTALPSKGVYRNTRLLRLARFSPCQKCNSPAGQGDVVACHIQGLRAHACGKGTGIKPHDSAVAFLCYTCHSDMDQHRQHPTPPNSGRTVSVDYSEQWLWLIAKTYHWLLTHGHLDVRE